MLKTLSSTNTGFIFAFIYKVQGRHTDSRGLTCSKKSGQPEVKVDSVTNPFQPKYPLCNYCSLTLYLHCQRWVMLFVDTCIKKYHYYFGFCCSVFPKLLKSSQNLSLRSIFNFRQQAMVTGEIFFDRISIVGTGV